MITVLKSLVRKSPAQADLSDARIITADEMSLVAGGAGGRSEGLINPQPLPPRGGPRDPRQW